MQTAQKRTEYQGHSNLLDWAPNWYFYFSVIYHHATHVLLTHRLRFIHVPDSNIQLLHQQNYRQSSKTKFENCIWFWQTLHIFYPDFVTIFFLTSILPNPGFVVFDQFALLAHSPLKSFDLGRTCWVMFQIRITFFKSRDNPYREKIANEKN